MKKLIKEWQTILDERRNYNNQSYHCVNVKRHNDDLDKESFFKKHYSKNKYKNKIKEFLNDDDLFSSFYYDYFLFIGWELINEYLAGYTDEEFNHIHEVFQLGRGGGWACFQTDNDDIIDELECYELTKDELEHKKEQLQETIDEVNKLKNEIKAINDNLDIEEMLCDYIDNNIIEIEEEKLNDYNHINSFIIQKINEIDTEINLRTTDRQFIKNIQRNLKSIKSLTEKQL